MPNTTGQVGPDTLKRMETIKAEIEQKVEELGRKLGIPEDRELIFTIIEIDEIRDLRAANDQLHAEEQAARKEKWRFIRNIVRNIDGLLDRYLGK